MENSTSTEGVHDWPSSEDSSRINGESSTWPWAISSELVKSLFLFLPDCCDRYQLLNTLRTTNCIGQVKPTFPFVFSLTATALAADRFLGMRISSKTIFSKGLQIISPNPTPNFCRQRVINSYRDAFITLVTVMVSVQDRSFLHNKEQMRTVYVCSESKAGGVGMRTGGGSARGCSHSWMKQSGNRVLDANHTATHNTLASQQFTSESTLRKDDLRSVTTWPYQPSDNGIRLYL